MIELAYRSVHRVEGVVKKKQKQKQTHTHTSPLHPRVVHSRVRNSRSRRGRFPCSLGTPTSACAAILLHRFIQTTFGVLKSCWTKIFPLISHIILRRACEVPIFLGAFLYSLHVCATRSQIRGIRPIAQQSLRIL